MDTKKLDLNVFFTILSFITLGLCGILINTFIIKKYDAQFLGKFNLLLSFLIIISQFSTAGVHLSVLKYNTHFHSNKKLASNVVTSAMLIVIVISLIIISLLYTFSNHILNQFNIRDFTYPFLSMLPAILFFSLNKVLLMGLIGLNNIRGYSFFNGIRYIFLLFYLIIFYFVSIPDKLLGLIFSCSEFTIFLILVVYFFYYVNRFQMPDIEWIKTHLSFGFRGLWGGALMETNTKIDILMIGYFLSEKSIGIYSFASMIADGFSMLYYVLRKNIEPIIGNAFFKKEPEIIVKTIRQFRKRYVPFIITAGITIVSIYPFVFGKILHIDREIVFKSWHVILILIGFNICTSFIQPFIGFVNLAGKPEYFSMTILISISLNITLNSILIPHFNLIGAAIATGIVFTFQNVMLYFLGKKFIFS